MRKKTLYLKLWPVEIALFVYFLVTFVLMAAYSTQLPDVFSHLTKRVLLLAAYFLVIYWQNRNRQVKTYYVLRLFVPLLLLPFLYKETDYLNNLFFQENLDPFFARMEFALFHTQPSLVFSEKLNVRWFSELMYFGYFSYYLLIVFIPLNIYLKRGNSAAERAIFIIINSFLIYYLIFILNPVAGPQFYYPGSADALPEGYFFGPLMKYIQQNGEGQTGAFPSSHVSICLILLYLCLTQTRKFWPLVLTVSILLILSTVYLKAHYVIDVLGAFLTTPVVYFISSTLFNRMTKSDPSL
ncbi:MAG: phosphatase PAP2 family protein [Chlorobi bacterium]|nr:phosphatase PAP2 family protein [Chlorobiota bacterium]